MEVTNGFEPLNNSFADCPLKPLEHVTIMNGGPGRSRTYGVSNVTDLQSAAIATMLTDPYKLCLAAVSGFEPNLCESKSHVLPLHYTAI